MRIINDPLIMQQYCRKLNKKGSVGFVPTMGALHDGHLSLLEYAVRDNRYAVMSIFVNPTQFSPDEDFKSYPNTFENDCKLAESVGCCAIFYPKPDLIYPASFQTLVIVDGITQKLEGSSRPNHFKGVTTVVNKLLNIVMAKNVYFGQKDAQQVLVIRKMIIDLCIPISLHVCPTIREKTGVAMSSRNRYLTVTEHKDASAIFGGLCAVENGFINNIRDRNMLERLFYEVLDKVKLISCEYLSIADRETLDEFSGLVGNSVLVSTACRTKESKTRLIDNIFLGGKIISAIQ